jgi:hypothetical protein
MPVPVTQRPLRGIRRRWLALAANARPDHGVRAGGSHCQPGGQRQAPRGCERGQHPQTRAGVNEDGAPILLGTHDVPQVRGNQSLDEIRDAADLHGCHRVIVSRKPSECARVLQRHVQAGGLQNVGLNDTPQRSGPESRVSDLSNHRPRRCTRSCGTSGRGCCRASRSGTARCCTRAERC